MPKVMTTAKGSMEHYLVTEQTGQILEEQGEGRGGKRRYTPRDTDSCCWLCHKEGDVICCEACPKHKVSAGTRRAVV